MKFILIFLFLIASVGFPQAPYVFTRDKGIPISIHYAVPDTNELKILQFDIVGNDNLKRKMIYLQQLSSSDSSGSGWFESIDSLYAYDGIDYFEHPDPGREWARIQTSATDYAQLRSDIGDSVATWNDTTQMKLSTSVKGYLERLSSANSNGGGWFTTRSTAFTKLVLGDSTVDGIVQFSHPTTELRWVRNNFIKKREIMTTWAGIESDSSDITDQDSANAVQNNVNFERVMACAYKYKKVPVAMPAGTILVYSDARTQGGKYGIRMRPNVPLKGQGKYESTIQIWDADTSSGNTSLIITDPTSIVTEELADRNFTIKDFGIKGNTKYASTLGAYTDSAHYEGGIFITTFTSGDTLRYLNEVKVDNMSFDGIALEVVSIRYAKRAEITNCSATECGFTTWTIWACISGLIENNYSDRTWGYMECGMGALNTTYAVEFIDTTGTLQIIDNECRRIWSGGVVVESARDVIISDNIFACHDTAVSRSTAQYPGIWIKTQLNNGSVGLGRVTISNNSISKFEGQGIRIGQGIEDSLAAWRIKVDGNLIEDNHFSGIFINAYDSTQIDVLDIGNNTLINNNHSAQGDLTWGGIAIWNTDSAYVHNNKVWNETASALQRVPLSLKNSTNAIIENNDFRSPSGLNQLALTTVNMTSEAPMVSGNQGLLTSNAVRFIDTTPDSFRYQNFVVDDSNGVWIDNALIYPMSTNSVMAKLYGYTGTLTSTKRLDNINNYSISYGFYNNTDTIAFTSTFTKLTNATKNKFTAYFNSGFTAIGDSIVVLNSGIYNVFGHICARQLTTNLKKCLVTTSKNGSNNSLGMGRWGSADTLENAISFGSTGTYAVNDYIDLRIKTVNLGTDSLVVTDAILNVIFIRK